MHSALDMFLGLSPASQPSIYAPPSQVGACSPSGRDPLQGGTNGDTSITSLQRRALLWHLPMKVAGLNALVNPVPAGAVTTCTAVSSVPVRPVAIFAPPSTAPFFTMSNLTVGLCTVIISGNPSCELFTANSQMGVLEFKEVGPGSPMVATITNIDVAAHRFDGALLCIDKSCEWGSLCESC